MPDTLRTTYRRADGELIAGEYGYTSELEWFENDDEPTDLIEEVWVLSSSRPLRVVPTGYVRAWCGECDGPISDGETKCVSCGTECP
jgi:hypothetical protein